MESTTSLRLEVRRSQENPCQHEWVIFRGSSPVQRSPETYATRREALKEGEAALQADSTARADARVSISVRLAQLARGWASDRNTYAGNAGRDRAFS
jgi:hypothetical protein